jgi:hypothetical protein
MDGMALDVRDPVARVLFAPAAVEVLGDQARWTIGTPDRSSVSRFWLESWSAEKRGRTPSCQGRLMHDYYDKELIVRAELGGLSWET